MGADDNQAMDTPLLLAGSVALSHWGVLRARGADAAAFLQGQLTSDVAGLATGQVRLAGYCSPKGRLLASFWVWRPAPDEFLLAVDAGVLPAVLKRLSMFVLRAKCKLDDASAEWRLHGLVGATAARRLGDLAVWQWRAEGDATLLRLPDAAGLPRALLASAAPSIDGPGLPLAHWRWLEVRSGIASIEAATVDRFVPQMLNYELLGGVDFQKGCYPGQEIVARSQYRGTLKRRALLFDVDAAAEAGQEIFHSADPGQPAGLVANAAPQPGAAQASSLLAEVKLNALEGGTLHLGTADGPRLQRRELPYTVTLDAAATA